MKKILNELQNSVSVVSCWGVGTSIDCNSDLLTVSEAATLLNLKVSRIRNLVFLKRIPFIKIGASVRFSKAALLDWIKCNSYNVPL